VVLSVSTALEGARGSTYAGRRTVPDDQRGGREVSLPVATGLTYDDLAAMPEPGVDGLRKELIDGELYVTPAPIRRHQEAVTAIVGALHLYRRDHGGTVYPAPTDVFFSDRTIVEPDVVFLDVSRAGELGDPRYVDVLPDLVVEVSSPSTRRLDLVKKRGLFEREGVPEFWFVDLDEDVVDVYRLDETGHYGTPVTLSAGEVLTCLAAPGFELPVADVLA
jgi:Uma2 family endonuclease